MTQRLSAAQPEAIAIGGYFELELPRGTGEYHADALRFQSSRAAFLALLQARRPSAVWVPWYICDSVIEPLRMAGTLVKRYEIDRNLYVKRADVAQEEWLLYVNYFGLCDRQVADVLRRFPHQRVVIDNAQAFFAPPQQCLANLYSPRKFIGVADGGYLITREHVETPQEIDNGTLARSPHLLKRIGADAESGYADYAAAEESLKLQPPRRMSTFTQRILASVDYEEIKTRRIANFDYLHSRLGRYNQFSLIRAEHAVPLCYPFSGAPVGLRAELQRQRIYTPSYWPDMERPVDAMRENATNSAPAMPEFERSLPETTLFVPCDQRIDSEQLERVAQRILERLT
jgi:hypothetical protein